MRSIKKLALIILICTQSAHAQTAYDNPNTAAAEAMTKAGWKMDAGAAIHGESMTTCPVALTGFETLIFTGPVEPNVLGTCTYKDSAGGGDAGLQVRRYIRDVGSSREAIQNDRALMEPRAGAPPPFMMVHFAPITTRDGQRGGRITITKTKGGLLVDCFGEAESLEKASQKVGPLCAN